MSNKDKATTEESSDVRNGDRRPSLGAAPGSRSGESAMWEALHHLWRNYPRWPSTFGRCSRGCEEMGRGSGPCADCCERDLAQVVGEDLAAEYHNRVRALRETERLMRCRIFDSENAKARNGE